MTPWFCAASSCPCGHRPGPTARTGNSSSSKTWRSSASWPSDTVRPGISTTAPSFAKRRGPTVDGETARAVQWQVDHFAEIPVLVVACLRLSVREGKGALPADAACGAVRLLRVDLPECSELLLAARSMGLGASLITPAAVEPGVGPPDPGPADVGHPMRRHTAGAGRVAVTWPTTRRPVGGWCTSTPMAAGPGWAADSAPPGQRPGAGRQQQAAGRKPAVYAHQLGTQAGNDQTLPRRASGDRGVGDIADRGRDRPEARLRSYRGAGHLPPFGRDRSGTQRRAGHARAVQAPRAPPRRTSGRTLWWPIDPSGVGVAESPPPSRHWDGAGPRAIIPGSAAWVSSISASALTVSCSLPPGGPKTGTGHSCRIPRCYGPGQRGDCSVMRWINSAAGRPLGQIEGQHLGRHRVLGGQFVGESTRRRSARRATRTGGPARRLRPRAISAPIPEEAPVTTTDLATLGVGRLIVRPILCSALRLVAMRGSSTVSEGHRQGLAGRVAPVPLLFVRGLAPGAPLFRRPGCWNFATHEQSRRQTGCAVLRRPLDDVCGCPQPAGAPVVIGLHSMPLGSSCRVPGILMC